jgi:hypothetical protein
MTTTAIPGPSSTTGAPPPITGPVPGLPNAPQPAIVNDNPDFAPNLSWCGGGVRDIRYLAHIGAGANVGGYPNQDVGFFNPGGGLVVVDFVPSAISNSNIAALANVTNGTPMTLVNGTAGLGITAQATAYPILPTGNVVPAGTLLIDTAPTWTGSGQSGAFAFYNPGGGGGRCVSITGVTGGAGGTFAVVGYDIYGVLVHQNIVVAAGANTVNGTKALKWVLSVTPQFTDAHNYSVGTADVYGFPLYSANFVHAHIFWNNALITAIAGYTAAVTTAASATTGDVRGTYAVQSASDGVKRLAITQDLSFSVIASTYAAVLQGMFGVPQA